MAEIEDNKGFTGRDFERKTINIPGELEPRTKAGIGMAAGVIYDYNKEKFQQTINEEYGQQIDSLNNSFNEVVQQDVIPRLTEAEEKVNNNIPYVIVYENQTVNIPCDPYGDYAGSETEIGTVVRLYGGNIVQEIEYDDSIAIDSPIDKGFTTSVEEDGSAIISILYTDISNLDDTTEVDFHILSQDKTYYGKVIFNKVKQGKSAYEEWKDLHPEIENPTIDLFLAELKNTDNIKGPKYLESETAKDSLPPSENALNTIYFVPQINSQTNVNDTYKIYLLDSNGYWRELATRPGDITNYAGIYDVSEDNKTGNTPKRYNGLSEAIADIITKGVGKGGMTIKFIQGTGADAKYVQYRLIRTTFPSTFNKNDWVLSEMPIEDISDADLEFSDNDDNVLARFAGGGIETKNFNSDKTQQNVGERNYEEFSTSNNYVIGDIVRKDGLLYKFISEHEAGDWDDTEVEQTNIPDILEGKIPDVEVADSPDFDLEFSDKQNNIVFGVGGGHCQTALFDSRKVVQKALFLSGKVVAFLGDSITYGTGATSNTKRYSTVFCNLADCTERNFGVAGTCLANNTANGLSADRFITRATAANLSSAHLIFVFGGTNDFSYDSKAIGDYFVEETITPPSGSDNRIGTKKKIPNPDNETFAGALHELILQIRSVSNAQIVFVTPLNRGRYNANRPISSEANVNGDYLQDFIHCIDAICEFYAIPVIHLGQLFGFDWQFDTNSSKNYYDNDGIHPNDYGHERIAKLLYSWCLNNLIM